METTQTEHNLNIRMLDKHHCIATNATRKDLKNYAWYHKTYARFINQLYSLLMVNKDNLAIGIMLDTKNVATYSEDFNAYLINPTKIIHGDKATILTLAMQQVSSALQSQYEYDLHIQIVTSVLEGIFNKTFRQ